MTHNTEHVIIRFAKKAVATATQTKISAGWMIVPFIVGALLF